MNEIPDDMIFEIMRSLGRDVVTFSGLCRRFWQLFRARRAKFNIVSIEYYVSKQEPYNKYLCKIFIISDKINYFAKLKDHTPTHGSTLTDIFTKCNKSDLKKGCFNVPDLFEKLGKNTYIMFDLRIDYVNYINIITDFGQSYYINKNHIIGKSIIYGPIRNGKYLNWTYDTTKYEKIANIIKNSPDACVGLIRTYEKINKIISDIFSPHSCRIR